MSINTGFAPVKIIAFAVAKKVKGVVITSSPEPMPAALSAVIRALVPLSVAIAYFVPQYLANASSNSATFSPCESLPDRRTSITAFSSSLPICGLAIGIIIFSPFFPSYQPYQSVLPGFQQLNQNLGHFLLPRIPPPLKPTYQWLHLEESLN